MGDEGLILAAIIALLFTLSAAAVRWMESLESGRRNISNVNLVVGAEKPVHFLYGPYAGELISVYDTSGRAPKLLENCDGFLRMSSVTNAIDARNVSKVRDYSAIIDMAAQLTEHRESFHVLLLVCGDSGVTARKRTQEAIVRAAHQPLCIVFVGTHARSYVSSLPPRPWRNCVACTTEEGVRQLDFSAQMSECRELLILEE